MALKGTKTQQGSSGPEERATTNYRNAQTLRSSQAVKLPPGAYRPRIGLTTYLQPGTWGVWENEWAAILPAHYLQGIVDAGGTPLLLAPLYGSEGPDTSVLDGLDGVLISGGVDVDPSRYGAEREPRTESQLERDIFDEALVMAALERELPLFGICRGAQVMNVARGGSLHQHVPDLLPEAKYQPEVGVFGSVDFTTANNTRIQELMGSVAQAPVYHHQSIDQLGIGVQITAQDSLGTVEGIEITSRGWNLGVQFHPEQNLDDLRLFVAFVQAAQEYAERHGRGGARTQGNSQGRTSVVGEYQ